MGGAERVALNIAQSASDGFEYHLVEVIKGRSAFTQHFLQEMQTAHIYFHRSPMPVVRFHYLFEKTAAVLFPLWFVFIFLKCKPCVIHCHTEIPAWATYLFFRLFPRLTKNCEVASTIHNTNLWQGMKMTGAKVETWLQRRGNVIAISKAVADNYRLNYHLATPIIYNGLSPATETRIYPHLVSGSLNIVFAGRLEKQKGIIHLVDIIKRLRNDHRYFFHIIGEGSQSGMMESELRGLANVRFNPPLYGIAAYLGSFDYMLMPSEFEGLALMSIEASMERLPTIINAAPGLADTLPQDWTLKVENNDMETYMHIFEKVIPKGNRQEWAEKAYCFAQENFSLRKMQEAYEKVYCK